MDLRYTTRKRADPPSPTGGLKRTGGVRFKPRDPNDVVTPELRLRVLARDGKCMAQQLDENLLSRCADQFGNPLDNGTYYALQRMQLDHVPDTGMTAMGIRPPSDDRHLVTLCAYHHIYSGWATSKHGRDLERAYLASLYPAAEQATQSEEHS